MQTQKRILRGGLVYIGDNVNIPSSVCEALNSSFADKWWKGMQIEHNSLLGNNTWELTELPRGQEAVTNKWVFAIKKDKKGEIERFKAKLVVRGPKVWS